MHDAPAPAVSGQIELSVHDLGQLWQSLDPLPFRERDLDQAVEEYLVASVADIPRSAGIEIIVRLPETEAARAEAGHVGDAIHNYFAYRAGGIDRELRELFRTGRLSLLVGLAVLAACTVAAQIAMSLVGGQLGRFLEEGLIILGWVANWHPIQIFLYGWQPLTRRRHIYRRLAGARVRLTPTQAAVG